MFLEGSCPRILINALSIYLSLPLPLFLSSPFAMRPLSLVASIFSHEPTSRGWRSLPNWPDRATPRRVVTGLVERPTDSISSSHLLSVLSVFLPPARTDVRRAVDTVRRFILEEEEKKEETIIPFRLIRFLRESGRPTAVPPLVRELTSFCARAHLL